jgi:hypothetical protein
MFSVCMYESKGEEIGDIVIGKGEKIREVSGLMYVRNDPST